MNADSRTSADRYDHYGMHNPLRHIITIGIACLSRNNLHFIKADDAISGDRFLHDADCWLIDAGNSDAKWLELVERSGLPLVVMVGDAAADMALIDAADGHILPDDGDAIVAAVLERAMQGDLAQGVDALRVADGSQGTARTMQALSIEASRIAERLAVLAAAEAASAPPVRGIDAVLVRRIIKLRRDRERYLPAEILADPAWDILLDLTAARLEGKAVPVSSLCIAAAVPTTTALRWIRSLTEAGLLQRRLDNHDARRSHVELADTAADAMLAYLRAFNDVFVLR